MRFDWDHDKFQDWIFESCHGWKARSWTDEAVGTSFWDRWRHEEILGLCYIEVRPRTDIRTDQGTLNVTFVCLLDFLPKLDWCSEALSPKKEEPCGDLGWQWLWLWQFHSGWMTALRRPVQDWNLSSPWCHFAPPKIDGRKISQWLWW